MSVSSLSAFGLLRLGEASYYGIFVFIVVH